MSDYAHGKTDEYIAELEKKLQKEYSQAYKETRQKLEKYLADFKRKDEKKKSLVDNGKLSQAEYLEWRKNQILVSKRWLKMAETLAQDMTKANVTAIEIANGKMADAFALNANYAAYDVENNYRTDFGFTLYDKDTVNRLVSENPDLLPAPSVDIPKDLRWNKQKITSVITQAVLQGKSIPDISKDMQTVAAMNKVSAVRTARTAMTAAENSGRQVVYERAANMGIKVKKEWIATLDGRTRHSHGMADGQRVEINGKFSVGSSKLRYPGDPQGAPEEVYNCRCTMATVEPPEILQGEEPRMTYQEWVKTKEGQEATKGKYTEKALDNGGEGGIIDVITVPVPEFTDNKAYNEILTDLKNYQIEYTPVTRSESERNEKDIITKICGGDETKGSCASVAFAYIGNKYGLDVLDFRGGNSLEFFASQTNLWRIRDLPGIKSIIARDKKETKAARAVLDKLELNKEYYFVTGKHAAIVRRTEDNWEYLELQSPTKSGWTSFSAYGSRLETLYKRFGCRKTVDRRFGKVWEQEAFAMEVDSFKNNKDFEYILGYLNTAKGNEQKGDDGYIK